MARLIQYEVTAETGGGVTVWVDVEDILQLGERAAVGHAAWRRLFENERGEWQQLTRRESGTARMLKGLIAVDGVGQIKAKFIASIEYKAGPALGRALADEEAE